MSQKQSFPTPFPVSILSRGGGNRGSATTFRGALLVDKRTDHKYDSPENQKFSAENAL